MACTMMTSAARWMMIGAFLATAVAQTHAACRVVAHKTLAEKTDDQGCRLFLVALVVADISDDNDRTTPIDDNPFVPDEDEDDNDDRTHEWGATAWAMASWVDSTQRDAFRRAHRPGARVPCAYIRGTARDADGPSPPQRSEPGTGPRIAALCAAAAAVTLVLGCGILACAFKTPWCRRIWHCGRRHPADWDDDAGAHRLVDSVFG
ncbi:hypothetical protein pqer_cds_581 [Pandoravirus quercus]|uniref:Uncharacterized protein n=1 Tax=Pandoravirus quercus TaxID=2107709 RepID=A0A2U7U981_9VIRU|nr:hypothetical protein pqer_cds_581 [Pandoravirus quercus]AVK75003.1 hypothetical protein pqer_cds_581 [Pandoravirus quercus]